MTTVFEKFSECPCCKHKINAATDVYNEGRVPEAGDLTLCFNCGELLIFTDGQGGLRKSEPDDTKDLDPETIGMLEHAKTALFWCGFGAGKVAP